MERDQKNNSKKTYRIYVFISLILVSLFAGAFIGIFQVGLKYFYQKVIYEGMLYGVIFNTDRIYLLPYLLGGIIVFFLVLIILKGLKLAYYEGSLAYFKRNKEDKIKWYGIPMIIISFAISFFIGLPVSYIDCLESSSLMMNRMSQDINKIDDEESDFAIKNAAFGAAMISPLAGFVSAFEDKKWKVTLSYVIKSLIAVILVTGISILIKLPFGMHFDTFFDFRVTEISSFTWKSLLTYLLLGVILAIIGVAILFLSRYIHKNVTKRGKYERKNRNWVTVLILLISSLCILCGVLNNAGGWPFVAYDGRLFLKEYASITEIGTLIMLAIIWFIYVTFLPSSSIPSGNTIATMSLGAILGIIFSMHGCNISFMYSSETPLMIVISMFALYGILNKKPFTAFALILTLVRWEQIPYTLLPALFAIAPGYLLIRFSKIQTFKEFAIN